MHNPVFMYIDESGDPNIQVQDNFFLGAIISNQPFPNNFFDNSFEKLKTDRDFHATLDNRTLDRKYYHASFDSKNAHSYCCEAIRQTPFVFTYRHAWIDKSIAQKTTESQLKDPKYIHARLIERLNLPSIVLVSKHINIIIAKREGSLTENNSEFWEYLFYNTLTNYLSEYPLLPGRLPTFTTTLAEASDPGVQVCDFILWSAQRKINGDPTWFDRLQIKLKESIKIPGDPIIDEKYSHMSGIKEKFDLLIEETPTQSDVESATANPQQRAIFYKDIITRLNTYSKNTSNKILQDYANKFKAIFTSHPKCSDAEIIAKYYLLACDTIPLYDISNQLDIKDAYVCKYLCGIIVNRTQAKWLLFAKELINTV